MCRRLKILMCLVLLGALIIPSGCGKKKDQEADAGKLKVAFVYVGPVGDCGWTFAHEKGRKFLEEQLGFVKTTPMENVPETSDAERVITNLALQGHRLIFTTSFGYMDATINVAKKFPDVKFMHCSGYKIAPNVGTYFGRIEEPRYLSGLVAGRMTKTNVIGYVAAHPIPEVVRGINSFAIGVHKVNPKAKIKIVWTHTWNDPPSEREAAESLMDFKADVIAQHQDTYAPQQAAQERGVFSIGYNTDMAPFAPKAHLTSPIWNWGPYYVKVAQSVQDGTWKSGQYWEGLKSGIVDLAPLGPMVPDDVKKLVTDERKKLEDGTILVFQGPLKDNTGKEKVKKGASVSDEEQLKMNWLVEGVEGKVEK